MGVVASILAALDPNLVTDRGVNIGELVKAILETSGFSEEDKALFGGAFGIDEAGLEEREWKDAQFKDLRERLPEPGLGKGDTDWTDEAIWRFIDGLWEKEYERRIQEAEEGS
jgi:hypothetical protein